MTSFGRATLGIAVLGFTSVACGSNEPSEPESTATDPPAAGGGGLRFERVNLGFVSAWVLVRSGEAAVVDTGVPGSQDEIAASLAAVGLDWSAVSDVVITHRHDDHAGSLPAVLEAAPGAAAWAGAGDLASISSPRPVTAVGDGDRVFGLDVIETPGHTAGHICVHDPVGGLLVAGDALNGADGGVIGANPDFTSDMDQAAASIRKLAELDFEQLLFGHGEPVLAGADLAVRELARA